MNQPPPVRGPDAGPPAPPRMSLPSRLFNLFATPGEVMDDVARSGPAAGNWVAPALLLMVVSWVGAWLVFSQPAIQQQLSEITSQAIEKQIAGQKMSEQQAEQVRNAAEKWGLIGAKVSAYAAPAALAFAVPFLWGLVLWLVGRNVFKREFPFMKAVEVVGLAAMIGVLETVVRTLLILVTGNLFASPSLVLLVRNYDPQNPVHGLLALTNVLVWWLLAVRAMGLARLAAVSFARAAAWVFGIWLLYSTSMVGLGFAMQALFKR